MATYGENHLKTLGKHLGEYSLSCTGKDLAPTRLQGVIADLTADIPDLQAPLRDLASRRSFTALLPYARSGKGSIQRDALIQEIKAIYHPIILAQTEEVLNGFLDISNDIIDSSPQNKHPSDHIHFPSRLHAQASHSSAELASTGNSEYLTSQQSKPLFILIFLAGIAMTTTLIAAFFIATRKQEYVQTLNTDRIQDADSLKQSQLNEIADEIFWRRHPSLTGKKLSQQSGALAREWLEIRQCDAIVDYKFQQIYPHMRGRLIRENQIEMASVWRNLYDQTPGCS